MKLSCPIFEIHAITSWLATAVKLLLPQQPILHWFRLSHRLSTSTSPLTTTSHWPVHWTRWWVPEVIYLPRALLRYLSCRSPWRSVACVLNTTSCKGQHYAQDSCQGVPTRSYLTETHWLDRKRDRYEHCHSIATSPSFIVGIWISNHHRYHWSSWSCWTCSCASACSTGWNCKFVFYICYQRE